MTESQSTCVIHRDRRASYTAQGILCCTDCWQQYQFEYHESKDKQLLSRPFLQQLVRASSEANFPEIAVDN